MCCVVKLRHVIILPPNELIPLLAKDYVCVTVAMVYMRKILKALMESKGHTGHSLYELRGVPPATTYRFLNGFIGEPRSGTIRRCARVYGLTVDACDEWAATCNAPRTFA